MTTEHPITPPEELVEEWYDAIDNSSTSWKQELATQAARWGDEQRLEACCEWLREARNHGFGYDMGRILADKLRAARRPKPPSLAEQAIAELQSHRTELRSLGKGFYSPAINAALERLQELESNG